jgi:hypothetical protein
MNDELERIWKETIMACLRYYLDIWLEGLGKTAKTSVTIAGVLAEI